jgi:hypothetical protein
MPVFNIESALAHVEGRNRECLRCEQASSEQALAGARRCGLAPAAPRGGCHGQRHRAQATSPGMGPSPSWGVRRAHGAAHMGAASMGRRSLLRARRPCWAVRAACRQRARSRSDRHRADPGLCRRRAHGAKSTRQHGGAAQRLGIEGSAAAVAATPTDRAGPRVRGSCQDTRGRGRGPAGRRSPAGQDHRWSTDRGAGPESAVEAPTAAAPDPPRCRRGCLLGPRAALLVRVERPHGLPTAKRQRRVRRGKSAAFRDVDYIDVATIVELDGRLGHEEAADRWADLDRDLSAMVAGELTLRVGWGQVLDPCRLACVVGGILIARGWIPTLRGCSDTCPVGDLATSSAPGAGEIAVS